jgi:hypothetical protein
MLPVVAAGTHIEKSNLQVTGSHVSVPDPIPWLIQVAPFKRVGSQGVCPLPQATFATGAAPAPALTPFVALGFVFEDSLEQAADVDRTNNAIQPTRDTN